MVVNPKSTPVMAVNTKNNELLYNGSPDVESGPMRVNSLIRYSLDIKNGKGDSIHYSVDCHL